MSESERLHEVVQEGLARAQEASIAAQQVAAKVALLSGTARSSDGGVRVYVDHRGLIEDVVLSEHALDGGVDELRASVLETMRAAIADVQEQAARLQAETPMNTSSLMDDDLMSACDALLSGVDERFRR